MSVVAVGLQKPLRFGVSLVAPEEGPVRADSSLGHFAFMIFVCECYPFLVVHYIFNGFACFELPHSLLLVCLVLFPMTIPLCTHGCPGCLGLCFFLLTTMLPFSLCVQGPVQEYSMLVPMTIHRLLCASARCLGLCFFRVPTLLEFFLCIF